MVSINNNFRNQAHLTFRSVNKNQNNILIKQGNGAITQNGKTQTSNIVKIDPELSKQLDDQLKKNLEEDKKFDKEVQDKMTQEQYNRDMERINNGWTLFPRS